MFKPFNPLGDCIAAYAAPAPIENPYTFPITYPSVPSTPEEMQLYIGKVCKVADEFDIMREISKLDDDSKKRIYDWLKGVLKED